MSSRSPLSLLYPLLLAAGAALQPQAVAASPLFVAYPPPDHQTSSDRIFLIGTGDPGREVTVNGRAIGRSRAGHFAPSFPLALGVNTFQLRQGSQTLTLNVKRTAPQSPLPQGNTFAQDSLFPSAPMTRQAGEWLCFGAIAPANAEVSVTVGNQRIAMSAPGPMVDLPANSAVLTDQTQPQVQAKPQAGLFQGCSRLTQTGDLGQPQYDLTLGGKTLRQSAPGTVTIRPQSLVEIAEVTADSGTTRSGPSTDYSRLTPLPKGARAQVTGSEGEWLRLDYGVWIKRSETKVTSGGGLPHSLIRGVTSRQVGEWTEVRFPLQVAVPMTVQQGKQSFVLTLHNTTAQTDTIRFDDNPLVERLDWQQLVPLQVQYTFHLKRPQQWGYKLRYEGTTLVLSLKNPPPKISTKLPLKGLKILLDPGHGGPQDLGARGPTGYPEKAVNLVVSGLLKQELEARGAVVIMTRTEDIDLDLKPRVDQINQVEPTLALSVHYNALPDSGDALKTKGMSMFWYHPQSHGLAMFLHNYLTARLNRPSAGIFWNNLALTRPHVAPTVLLELGFMINPDEFEWIVNSSEQKKLAGAIADGVVMWLARSKES